VIHAARASLGQVGGIPMPDESHVTRFRPPLGRAQDDQSLGELDQARNARSSRTVRADCDATELCGASQLVERRVGEIERPHAGAFERFVDEVMSWCASVQPPAATTMVRS
jgi:hypothetical protein